jgi:hypothetical protein
VEDDVLDFYVEDAQKRYRGKTMETEKVEEKIEKKSRKPLMLLILILIIILTLGITFYFTTSILPNISKTRINKEQTCQNLCEQKNMIYEKLDKEQNCMCNFKDEPNNGYLVAIINDNGSIIKPEPIILSRANGLQFTCTLNRTTKTIKCEDI